MDFENLPTNKSDLIPLLDIIHHPKSDFQEET